MSVKIGHPCPKRFEKVHEKPSYQRCKLYKLSQRKWWEHNLRHNDN